MMLINEPPEVDIKSTRIIPILGTDKVALIDADFAKEALKHRWTGSSGYAISYRLGLMHRWVMGVGKEQKQTALVVDHINHNRLDNRRCNLRLVTSQENGRNQPKNKKHEPVIQIRLSPSEKELLEEASTWIGLCTSTWMRHECLRLAKEILQAREKRHETISGRST